MRNFVKDAVLFILVFLVFQIGRLVLLHTFNENHDIPSLSFWLLCVRFDIMTTAYFVLPTFIASIFSIFSHFKLGRLKTVYAVFALSFACAIAFVNFYFFEEYKSQFNYWIWGLFQDQTELIFLLIWENYPIIKIAGLVILSIITIYIILKKLYAKCDSSFLDNLSSRSLCSRLSIAICLSLIALLALRGGKITGAPLRLGDISTLEPSSFLNNIIPSSAYCLKYEISNFLGSKLSKNLSYFSADFGDIPNYTEDVFRKGRDLDLAIECVSNGSPLKIRPSHIFFIVSESHSAWPLYDKYTGYDLLPQTRRLSKGGIFCKYALPSGMGTNNTINALIRNIPYSGATLVKRVPELTRCLSLPNTLKRLGYSTRFYYSGTGTWCGIGNMSLYYGFDQFIGAESMGVEYSVDDNAWGISDKEFFDFIDTCDIPEKSFSLILTTSNHAPFNINLKNEGLDKEISGKFMNEVYHLWYADKYLGLFCDKILKKYPNSIIVISGDHPARVKPELERFGNLENACVPILIFGKPIAESNLNFEVSEASHMDILPTLVELLADKGFKYQTFGESLLNKSRIRPALNPYFIEDSNSVYSLESSSCPPKLREFARKYFTLCYYKLIEER